MRTITLLSLFVLFVGSPLAHAGGLAGKTVRWETFNKEFFNKIQNIDHKRPGFSFTLPAVDSHPGFVRTQHEGGWFKQVKLEKKRALHGKKVRSAEDYTQAERITAKPGRKAGTYEVEAVRYGNKNSPRYIRAVIKLSGQPDFNKPHDFGLSTTIFAKEYTVNLALKRPFDQKYKGIAQIKVSERSMEVQYPDGTADKINLQEPLKIRDPLKVFSALMNLRDFDSL